MGVVVNTVRVALSGAIPAGSNVIGGVTQSGTWNVGITGTPTVTLGAGSASVGTVTVGNSTLAVTQSGTWNIGSITTLPALASGTNTIGKLAANSGVDIGDVDVTSVTPGTAAGSLGKAEDTAHNSGDTGVAVWGVRNDFGNSFSGTDGDYTPFNLDAQGRLRTLLYGYDAGAMDHYPIAVTAGAVNVTGTVSTQTSVGTTITDGSASVTTTAGAMSGLGADATRLSVTLTNLGTDNVWIGTTTIAANRGLRLAPGQTAILDKSPTPAIWAVSSSGTQTVAFLVEK